MQEGDELGRIGAGGHDRGRGGHGDEQQDEHAGYGGVALVEEDGDRQDGAELPDAAYGHDANAKRPAQDPRVPQDRQQGAQGGGGEGQSDDDRIQHRAQRHQRQRGQQGHSQRDHPTEGGQPQGSAANAGQIQLETGQEHEKGKPHLAEGRDHAVHVGDIEKRGADDDPEADLEHHVGDGEPSGDLAQDRRDHGYQGDEQQGRDRRQRHGLHSLVSGIDPAAVEDSVPAHSMKRIRASGMTISVEVSADAVFVRP